MKKIEKWFLISFLSVSFFCICSFDDLKNHSSSNFVASKVLMIDTEVIESKLWKVKKIYGKNIYFENGKILTTNLYNLRYIGQLPAIAKAPFLILAGKDCKECDENLSIYIQSPSDGPLKQKPVRYSYPGTEYDYENKDVNIECRFFYGKLTNGRYGALWIQNEKNESGKYNKSVFKVELIKDVLKESTSNYDSSTVNLLIKSCKELPGIKTTSEP
jgi:hypothetical protein